MPIGQVRGLLDKGAKPLRAIWVAAFGIHARLRVALRPLTLPLLRSSLPLPQGERDFFMRAPMLAWKLAFGRK